MHWAFHLCSRRSWTSRLGLLELVWNLIISILGFWPWIFFTSYTFQFLSSLLFRPRLLLPALQFSASLLHLVTHRRLYAPSKLQKKSREFEISSSLMSGSSNQRRSMRSAEGKEKKGKKAENNKKWQTIGSVLAVMPDPTELWFKMCLLGWKALRRSFQRNPLFSSGPRICDDYSDCRRVDHRSEIPAAGVWRNESTELRRFQIRMRLHYNYQTSPTRWRG